MVSGMVYGGLLYRRIYSRSVVPSACSISEIQIVFLGTLIGDESDFSGIYIGIYIWDDSSYIKQIGIYPWFFD